MASSSTSRTEPLPASTWLLRVAYDGAAYAGWQWQPDLPTVQGELHGALTKLLVPDRRRRTQAGEPLPVWDTRGCSRTDTGVHALAQMVAFTPPASAPPIPPERVAAALNDRLPHDIRVLALSVQPATYNLRGAVVGKAYTYVWHRGPLRNPFWHRYCLPVHSPLPPDLLAAATDPLIGTHDFRHFAVNSEGSGRAADDTIRTLLRFHFRELGPFTLMTVVGERFLYRMVRRLAGLCQAVGAGKLPVADVPALLTLPELRHPPFDTAPPMGLYLEEVFFDPAPMAAYLPGPLPLLTGLGL